VAWGLQSPRVESSMRDWQAAHGHHLNSTQAWCREKHQSQYKVMVLPDLVLCYRNDHPKGQPPQCQPREWQRVWPE